MLKATSGLFRAAAWLCSLGLMVGSWMPGEQLARTDAGTISGRLDHFAAYLISTLVWVTAYPRWSPSIISSALVIYAGALEIGQIYVPGRHSTFADFAASCSGVLVVGLAAEAIRRRTHLGWAEAPAQMELGERAAMRFTTVFGLLVGAVIGVSGMWLARGVLPPRNSPKSVPGVHDNVNEPFVTKDECRVLGDLDYGAKIYAGTCMPVPSSGVANTSTKK